MVGVWMFTVQGVFFRMFKIFHNKKLGKITKLSSHPQSPFALPQYLNTHQQNVSSSHCPYCYLLFSSLVVIFATSHSLSAPAFRAPLALFMWSRAEALNWPPCLHPQSLPSPASIRQLEGSYNAEIWFISLLELRSILLLFSRQVMSNSLWPQGLQHARLPCLALSPGVCSDSCPIVSITLSNHLIFCCLLLLLPSVFSSIRLFFNE